MNYFSSTGDEGGPDRKLQLEQQHESAIAADRQDRRQDQNLFELEGVTRQADHQGGAKNRHDQAHGRHAPTGQTRQQDAEQKCQLAREEIEKYQQMQQDFATERSTMLAQVKAAVAQTQTELMQGIRTEVEEDRSRWQEIVQRQKDAFLQELRHRALQQIQETIRQVLAALADVQLEQLVIQVFLKRVRNWDREEKQVLCQAIAATDKTQEAIISSSFEISEELRQQIISVLRQELVGDLDIKFEVKPALICGIELKTSGRRIAWNVEEFLNDFEEDLAVVFTREARGNPKIP